MSVIRWGQDTRIAVSSVGGASVVRRNIGAFIEHIRSGGRVVFVEDSTKMRAAFEASR